VTRVAYVTLFARDIERLATFYGDVFGFRELTEYRNEMFRALDAGGVWLGFSGIAAYELLGIAEYRDASGARGMLTIEVDEPGQVASLSERAVAAGARLIQPAHRTYYGAWQSVLADPEDNIFRINKLDG
jgi:catechol 2,3-dioxygenase-like lactoylglutathione lyase family enzyme